VFARGRLLPASISLRPSNGRQVRREARPRKKRAQDISTSLTRPFINMVRTFGEILDTVSSGIEEPIRTLQVELGCDINAGPPPPGVT
jgi:hypothetical protein